VTQFTLGFIRLTDGFDRRRLDTAVRTGAAYVLALSERTRGVQTGEVGNYLLILVVGAAFVALSLALARLAG
jgi:hypothetical protein